MFFSEKNEQARHCGGPARVIPTRPGPWGKRRRVHLRAGRPARAGRSNLGSPKGQDAWGIPIDPLLKGEHAEQWMLRQI